MKKKGLTYEGSGVSYNTMDPLKRMAQIAGRATTKNLRATPFKELPQSRGESAYVVEYKNFYMASVIEGLGTKNLIADETAKITKKSHYDSLAQDTVAMIVNDLIVVGAKPVNVLAYWAAGHTDWFKNEKRLADLVNGWKKACDLSGAVWGGGETPTPYGVIEKHAIDLGGSAWGIIDPKKRLTLGDRMKPGDRIILLESSGVHANGISLVRKIAKKLPKNYATKLKSGKILGEVLLRPTKIYAKVVQDLFKANIDVTYMANITGHGWRKIMRYKKPFTYRITKVPPIPEEFHLLMEKGPVDEMEAFGNWNMGSGYMIIVRKNDVKRALGISKRNKIKAYDVGVIEKGPRQVIIEPRNITFAADALNVRA